MTQSNRPGYRTAPQGARRSPAGTGARTAASRPNGAGYRASGSTGYPSGRRPASSGRAANAPRSNRYQARAAYARRRKSRETLKFAGVVALLTVIIVLAVIQIRSSDRGSETRTVENTQTTPAANGNAAVQTVQTEQPSVQETFGLPQQTQAPAEVQAAAEPTPAAQQGEWGAVQAGSQTQQAGQTGTSASGYAVFGTKGDGLRSVRFRFIGDIMVTTDQLYSCYSGGKFDFTGEFAYVAKYLANADFTIANMETTLGKYKDKNYSGYPQFNAPETILGDLKGCGIDMFTLCNNHMLDRWFDGMKNTVNWVEQYGYQYVGAYRTKAERGSVKIVEINGIKFGFLAYTTSTNTMEDRGCDPAVKEYGVPYFSSADIEGDVKRLRSAGAEVIICLPHWGDEYIREPDQNQQYYAKKLLDAGIEVIIGSHSHMVQPMGYKTTTTASGARRESFIMWSMGNFISNMTKKYCDCSIILELTVNEQSDGTFRVDNVGYIPVYTWTYGAENKKTCITLPCQDFLNKAPQGMDSSAWARLKESYNDMNSLLGSSGKLLAQ